MTGGGTGAGTSPGTATTEVYQPGAGRWRLVGPLPAAVRGVAGAALANTVYMMGRLAGGAYMVLKQFRASIQMKICKDFTITEKVLALQSFFLDESTY